MKRPRQHVMETEAEQLLEQFLPSEWITRPVPKDYGIDYEIELVDHYEVSGKRIWVQLKAVDKECEIQTRYNELIEEEEEYISYSVSANLLDYATKCPFPLLLFLADLDREEIYWLPLQDEITFSLSKRKPTWVSQSSATVRIPIRNRLSLEKDNNYPGLRWYALEPSRVYALLRLHESCDSFLQSNPLSFEFADGWIDPHEENLMRKSIENAKHLIRQSIGISILFGEQGVDVYRLMVPELEESLRLADKVLDLLDHKEFSFEELSMSCLRVAAAVHKLELTVTSYFELNRRFTLYEDLMQDTKAG